MEGHQHSNRERFWHFWPLRLSLECEPKPCFRVLGCSFAVCCRPNRAFRKADLCLLFKKIIFEIEIIAGCERCRASNMVMVESIPHQLTYVLGWSLLHCRGRKESSGDSGARTQYSSGARRHALYSYFSLGTFADNKGSRGFTQHHPVAVLPFRIRSRIDIIETVSTIRPSLVGLVLGPLN